MQKECFAGWADYGDALTGLLSRLLGKGACVACAQTNAKLCSLYSTKKPVFERLPIMLSMWLTSTASVDIHKGGCKGGGDGSEGVRGGGEVTDGGA